jgi:hypothetical protein
LSYIKQSTTVSTVLILVMVITMTGNVAAQQSNNTTSNSSVENTWNFTETSINRTFSVGTTDSLDLGLVAEGNESEEVEISAEGNISDFMYSIESPVNTIPGQEVRVLNQVSVDRSQSFGVFNGSINGVGGNESESVNVSFKIVDDISPVIDSVSLPDLMSLTNSTFVVEARDNLNISSVEASIVREVEIKENNTTKTVNRSFKDEVVFEKTGGDRFEYVFGDSDVIGSYYANVTVTDTSNNSVSRVKGFSVDGLDSISVESTNFVFDTIRPKESTSEGFVVSDISGKSFSVSLTDLGYGGNETVKVGVVPPEGDSPEIIEVGQTRSYSDSGVYSVELIHSGSDEVKGTHSVTGELRVVKPGQHVEPRNVSVSFSGTVKNVDKPPERCLKVAEFDACIGYSFDSVKKNFQDEYSVIGEENESFAYKISRVPIRQVEGSNEWKDSTSFTMGEYNESLTEAVQEKEKAEKVADSMTLQRNIAGISALIFILITLGNGYVKGTMETEKKIRESNIGQVVENRDDVSLGRRSNN